MYIKNIFDVKNYKALEDGFKIKFEDITYIIGDNAKNKSTIGSLPVWILTGYNLFGNNREEVFRDKDENTMASMTIIDNLGSEHVITRCKGKDNFVLIDGIRTTQEILSKSYKDVHAFLCAYNPSYFKSMDSAKQKELLLRILPVIKSEYAFTLLSKEEQTILEKPVIDLKGFNKAKRAEIKELKSELYKMIGNKNALVEIAIQKEDELKNFEKMQELNKLEMEYERLIENTDNILSLEDLEKDIKKLENKILTNVNIELKEFQENMKKEKENLKNVSSNTSMCPTCKQPIKNLNLINALRIKYQKNIDNIEEKIGKLKVETKEFIIKKNKEIEQYRRMKTPEMQEQTKRRDELKSKINQLREEKNQIDLFNKEAEIKHNNIVRAKERISTLNAEIDKISDSIDKYEKQIKIVTRLNLLTIKEQMKAVSKYLDKVTISFSKVDEDTGEILDVYEIKYNGILYEKLSKSYKLRADIEIATLVNKVMDIKTMMFIDDVESITNMKLPEETQIIIAKVVKFNELEVIYSYSDLLLKEKASIDKRIQEENNLYIAA